MKPDNEAPSTRLRGRPLALGMARGLWIVMVAVAVGLYVLGIPFQPASIAAQIGPLGLAQLQQAGMPLGFYAGYLTALGALFALAFAAVAAVIFWRRSDDWMALLASLTLVVVGVTSNGGFAPLVGHYAVWLFLSQFVSFLGGLCVYLFFYLFPDGHFAPRWMGWLVPLLVVHEALRVFRPDLLGDDPYWYLVLGSAIFALVYRYWRVSNGLQRQQTKWVVFGVALGALGLLAVGLFTGLVWPGGDAPAGPSDLIITTLGSLCLLLIPISIGIAILRSRLWDIDILIRRTLTYAALTGLLALVYFGVVVALQALFTAVTGSARSELVTVLSTLVIAALFVPLRGRLQAVIDHRFYRRKYDAARTLAQFGAGLRDEVNLDSLSVHLLSAVDETMQPAGVSLWLKGKDEG